MWPTKVPLGTLFSILAHVKMAAPKVQPNNWQDALTACLTLPIRRNKKTIQVESDENHVEREGDQRWDHF